MHTLERINTFFLLRELTNVMQQIIENKVNNVSLYTTHNTGVNAESVLKMEQIMSHVRHAGESLQWTQLVSRLVDDFEELETTLSKILLYLFETYLLFIYIYNGCVCFKNSATQACKCKPNIQGVACWDR
jgi:hypothetical protein